MLAARLRGEQRRLAELSAAAPGFHDRLRSCPATSTAYLCASVDRAGSTRVRWQGISSGCSMPAPLRC
ncbi:hypothetical protein, partial [Streptomyces sp. NPDC096934]|uniref:hypothetical protein n=1 Tax=Streptomyces sp. NPDC096934 TaxID=3155551 RepID=UPI003318772D